MKISKIVWTFQAQLALRKILDYRYKDIPEARKIVRTDIINASKSISFPEQYQKDEYAFQYRRIIVRDYKLLYRTSGNTAFIMNVICSKASSS